MEEAGKYGIIFAGIDELQSQSGVLGSAEPGYAEMDEIRELREIAMQVADTPQVCFTTT